jgi:DNA-binding IclR family transcriptional regulator
VGKVLLADRDPGDVRAIIARTGMRQLTRRSLSSLDALEYELERVRARGHAVDRGEVVPDVSCIAVPVHDRDGAVIAAMSVSVPNYRFEATRDDILAKLVEAGDTISARLVQTDLLPDRDLPKGQLAAEEADEARRAGPRNGRARAGVG